MLSHLNSNITGCVRGCDGMRTGCVCVCVEEQKGGGGGGGGE